MSEQVEVRAKFTAENDASPQIKKLLKDIEQLESKLKKLQRPLSVDPVSKAARSYLELKGGDIRRRMAWARAERDSGRMTMANYNGLRNQILGMNKEFEKTGRLTKAQRAEFRKLISMADGYAAVWNHTYRQRENQEHRLHNKMVDLSAARDRLSKRQRKEQEKSQRAEDQRRTRSFNDQLRQARYSFGLRQRYDNELNKEREASRRNFRRNIGTAASTPGRMLNRLDSPFFSSPFFYGSLAAGGALAAGRSFIKSGADLDTAETYAKIHVGLDDKNARDWRDNFAIPKGLAMGIRPGEMLSSATEAAKAGVPDAMARQFAEMATKLSKVFGMTVDETTDALGYAVAQELGAGRLGSGFDGVRRLGNMAAGLAGQMATKPAAMLSFMRTGLGSGSLMGLNQESTMAFGAAATSVGAQGQQAARMLGHIAEQIHELPLHAQNVQRKRTKTAEDRLFLQIPGMLGYGSYGNLTNRMKANPNDELFNLIKSFGKIKDPFKRDQALTAFFGADFKRFIANLINSPGVMDDARSKAAGLNLETANADYQSKAWEKYIGSIQHFLNVIDSSWDVLKAELGDVLKPFISDSSQFMSSVVSGLRSGNMKVQFRSFLEGIVKGFGFDSFGQMLNSVFGGPGTFNALSGLSTFRFGQGLGEGLTAVYKGLKLIGSIVVEVMKSLVGADLDPKAIGKFTAELLGFSAAMHFARPAISILGALKDALVGLAAGVMSIIGIKSLMGGGAAVAGRAGLMGIAGLAAAGLPIALTLAGVALVGTALAVAIMNWEPIKSWFSSMWTKRDIATGRYVPSPGADRSGYRELYEYFFPPKVQKQSYGGGDFDSGLIQKATFQSELAQPIRQMSQQMTRFGDLIQLATFGGGSGGSRIAAAWSGGAASGGGGGSIGGIGNGPVNSFGLTRRGIIGGAGGAARGGGFNPAARGSSAGSFAGFGGTSMLDAIARAEGTAGRGDYEATLGYGRYGTPSKPLTQMTLAEAFAFGRQIKARHGSSSAIGRYQIVGNTMRDAARALGMDMNTTKFDAATQDRMAQWIASRQGLGAWEGFKKHPGELAKARAAMAGGGAASTSTSLGGLIPVKTGSGVVMMDPSKGFGQAFAGGKTHAGTLGLAQSLAGIPGGLDRFTAFNDAYHAGSNSKHALGLAGDVTIKDPHQSGVAAEYIRNQMRAAGLNDTMFKVLDEYKNPSRGATGGHLHYQFQNQEAAAQYRQYMERQKAIADAAKAAESPASAASRVPQTPQSIIQGVPESGMGRGGRFNPGAGGGGGSNGPISINIHGNNSDPEALAGLVQRRVSENMNWRTHDVEYDL